METIKNEYQLSKTLRFGLTLKEKPRKEGYTGEIYQSHKELKELISISERKIKESLEKLNKYNHLPIEEVRSCYDNIHRYLKEWEKVYTRYDQIDVTKDFYRHLERKARFDGFWKKDGVKMPHNQSINLSSLRGKYEQKERKDYILEYWSKNIKETKQRIYDFEPVLIKFEEAKKENRADKNLSEVELRKMFLSLLKSVLETLKPLWNKSIDISISNLTENENDKILKDFVLTDRTDLVYQIESLQKYFEENGGYVYYGKATLNKYTALQKPDVIYKDDKERKLFTDSIQMIKAFLAKYENAEQLNNYIETIKDKKSMMQSNNLSVIEKVQLFKYKTIPASVRSLLIEYLFKTDKIDRKRVAELFNTVGIPKNPAKDYSELKNKEVFDLYKYPLKVAFDYAWESLANSHYHSGIDFPKKQCTDFLKDVFNANSNDDSFLLYADLLFLRENLAPIDHPDPTISDDKRADCIHKARSILGKSNFPNKEIKMGDKKFYPKDAIKTWLDLSNKEQQRAKKDNNTIFKQYEKAKGEIGRIRGGLKNKNTVFYDLTKTFKDLASDFGKSFATLRDKLNEANELNKISHYGIVVEDKNKDRYFLLSPLSENRDKEENLFENEPDSELITYRVKSLTSKTLWKFLRNKKGSNEGFHKENWTFPQKSKEELNTDSDFLKYVKDRLTQSEMAKAQAWNEFKWNLDACQTYEAIEKEVDRKGYVLKDDSKISKSTIEKLVKEGNCLLLPIVNQDITKENHGKTYAVNQFTKDWENLFGKNNGYRLHPEFKISYRQPTPDYPSYKRYSRFQLIGHLLCEYLPQSVNYISKKEQVQLFNDKEAQKKQVESFNAQLKPTSDFYVFGIDRGLKQLATLCVLKKDGQIKGDFEIYTRKLENKQWVHTPLSEKRHILDLSNLRVETRTDGVKVLVDLSVVELNSGKENQQKIKLKELAYIRKVQFQLQGLASDIQNNRKGIENIDADVRNIISPYKEGVHYAELPQEKIDKIIERFKELVLKTDTLSKQELKDLIELDASEDLKRGVVANMIGVIAFLIKECNYNVYISLEDLTKSFYPAKNGLNGEDIPVREKFYNQENDVLAGLGLYHFFEIQLLRKLFRIQNENEILHLIPAFRSTDNYEKLVNEQGKVEGRWGNKEKYFPFGRVQFVLPDYTSHRCPQCGAYGKSKDGKAKIVRSEKEGVDTITCNGCKYQSPCTKLDDKQNKNIHYIQNGDDNGAYHIALKTWRNLKEK